MTQRLLSQAQKFQWGTFFRSAAPAKGLPLNVSGTLATSTFPKKPFLFTPTYPISGLETGRFGQRFFTSKGQWDSDELNPISECPATFVRKEEYLFTDLSGVHHSPDPHPTNNRLQWQSLISTFRRPNPLVDRKTVDAWESIIDQEMGILPFSSMKGEFDWSQPDVVESFSEALCENSEKIYRIFAPKHFSLAFFKAVFTFAKDNNLDTLPQFNISSRHAFDQADPGRLLVYDFNKQDIDSDKLRALISHEGSNNSLHFRNVPLTEDYINAFTLLAQKLADENHYCCWEFKPSSEVSKRMFEKMDRA